MSKTKRAKTTEENKNYAADEKSSHFVYLLVFYMFVCVWVCVALDKQSQSLHDFQSSIQFIYTSWIDTL